MTADPPPAAPEPPFGSPHVRAQLAVIDELEKQCPPPTWDEVRPDWERYYAQGGTVVLEPYFRQLVAVYNKQVVGSDPHDELALRIRLSRQCGLHPERFVISYCG